MKHPLAKTITQYGFFSYAVSEALHLSAAEEADIITIITKIEEECRHIDRHTQDIIVSQIDLLLAYSNRFYERQSITRKNNQSDLLARFKAIVNNYHKKRACSRCSRWLLTCTFHPTIRAIC